MNNLIYLNSYQCIFQLLNSEELTELNSLKKPFSFNRGQFLNQQNQTADGLYYITSGFAKIIWPEKDEKESIIKIVGPGDMTGYRCLFSEKKFRATAVSLSKPLEGFFVPKEFFFKLLAKNSEFNFEILKRMGTEIRRSEDRLRSFAQNNVRERMAETLLELNSLCGVPISGEDKIILEIQMSRDELASWIGTAKETVVRCLSDMRQEGLIDQSGSMIVIKDLNSIIAIVKKS